MKIFDIVQFFRSALRPVVRLYWRAKSKIPVRDVHVHPESNPLHAYRCYGGQSDVISPVSLAATVTLSDSLIQTPGLVEVSGQVFDLREDGVYRFYKLPSLSEQRIVCTGGVESLLKILSYLWSYGNQDNKLSKKEIFRLMSKRTVCCSCGILSVQAAKIMNLLGIEARTICGISRDVWGGQDDGHTLLEIRHNQKWVMYDPSLGCLFKDGDNYLSFYDFSKIDISRVTLCFPAIMVQRGPFRTSRYNYDFWVDARILSEDILRAWYKRVLDIPMIRKDDNFYYPASVVPADMAGRMNSRYKPLAEVDFKSTFYGDNNAA